MPTPVERELAYYEALYSGFAQQHFARPAVVAFRRYLAARIRERTGATSRSRVLSLGCGIGDTEILLAPYVAEIVGIDLSPKAVAQARADVTRARIDNLRFLSGNWQEALGAMGRFDLVLGVFFFHHLTDEELARVPGDLAQVLRPGGVIYGLEPSARRLAGVVGKLLFPRLMKRYQTEDERQLPAGPTGALFQNAGYQVRTNWFDFVSTPLAGLLPGWRAGYRAARLLDHALVKVPVLNEWSANFELIARRAG
jgi:SAM-dependent methyltransferase